MRSLLVEFLRFNDLGSGSWRCGDPYLVAAANHPVREFKMPLGQDDFLDLIVDLRYQAEAQKRVAALEKVGEIATGFLGSDSLSDINGAGGGAFPLQLDLVLNPRELAALPFEAATDSQGQPLFARGDKPVVLTRRVRQNFVASSGRWPARPRILYVWASPPGAGEVPSNEHEKALCAALAPWIPVAAGTGCEADLSGVLTTLAKASLSDLEQACANAVKTGQPYTHVHVLAHGYPIEKGHRERFGIALHSPKGEGEGEGELVAVPPEDFEKALAPLKNHAVVVTLATCDAANLANMTTSRHSTAHQLHMSGFPIVVASQLPLTVPGSNLMVEIFYKALLAGEDVRGALHKVRVALYANQKTTGHDWASLIGYARLPEAYADHLLDVRLESVLGSLKTIQGWSDRLLMQKDGNRSRYDQVAAQLAGRIEDLERFLREAEGAGRKGVLAENLGLLGSAEKRLAELCFVRSGFETGASARASSRQALQRSRDWYQKGFEGNLSNHWAATQLLSLEAALEGRIGDPGSWHVALKAAEIDARKPAEIWALGSLAELHLVARLAGQSSGVEAATRAIATMKERIQQQLPDKRDEFPLESTARQLRRYGEWWTTANDFFPGTADLSADAMRLLEALRR